MLLYHLSPVVGIEGEKKGEGTQCVVEEYRAKIDKTFWPGGLVRLRRRWPRDVKKDGQSSKKLVRAY